METLSKLSVSLVFALFLGAIAYVVVISKIASNEAVYKTATTHSRLSYL